MPEATQTGFVRMLRQAGGQAEQILVQATDENRHGVVAYSRTTAAGCMRGASTQEIARELYVQVQKRVAAKAATRPQTTPTTTATNELAGKHDRQRDDRAVRRPLGPAESPP